MFWSICNKCCNIQDDSITTWKLENRPQLNPGVCPITASGKCGMVHPEEWRAVGPYLKGNSPDQHLVLCHRVRTPYIVTFIMCIVIILLEVTSTWKWKPPHSLACFLLWSQDHFPWRSLHSCFISPLLLEYTLTFPSRQHDDSFHHLVLIRTNA